MREKLNANHVIERFSVARSWGDYDRARDMIPRLRRPDQLTVVDAAIDAYWRLRNGGAL